MSDPLHDFVTNIEKPENMAILDEAIRKTNEEQRRIMDLPPPENSVK